MPTPVNTGLSVTVLHLWAISVAVDARVDLSPVTPRSPTAYTNPAEAAEGTIRKLFATSISANAIHGSDSNENANLEGEFFFSMKERF